MLTTCPECGLEIEDDVKVCPHCSAGSKKEKIFSKTRYTQQSSCCSCCTGVIFWFLLIIGVILLLL